MSGVEKTNECVGDPCNLVRQFLKMSITYVLPLHGMQKWTRSSYVSVTKSTDNIYVCILFKGIHSLNASEM